MTACGIAPEDDDGNAAARKQPDVVSILRNISASMTLDILKSNYQAAMQMLDQEHHAAITKAKDARKQQLMEKVTA